MAIIGKIRQNSIWVVIIVAVTLLIFVLSDRFGNQGNVPQQQNTVAGEVFGEEIDLIEYEEMASQYVDGQKAQNPELSEDEIDRIRENVWNQMVNRKIFDKELAGFNFNTSPAELNDLIFGDNIQNEVKENPYFKNRFTQQFSLDSVKVFRQRCDKYPQVKNYWVNAIEIPIKEQRKITKYFNMIAKGMYVTTAEVNHDYANNNRKYKIKFVAKTFDQIPDSTIKVTDDEIRDYYNKHKHRKKFEQYGTRSFSWVEFLLAPSAEDIEYTRKRAEEMYARFKETKNDSSFVMTYAETKNFNNDFMQPGSYPAEVDSLIQKADSGSVIGPYRDGEFWKVIKIRGMKFEPEARCRHILIGNQVRGPQGEVLKTRTDEEVSRIADSIMNIIKKKNNFDEMVALTDDLGSKETKGVYEWFGKGRMVPEFEKACFEGKLNVLTKVKTQFGIHLVEPLDRRDAKRVKSAIVDYKIKAGKETEMAVRSQAVEFMSKVTDPAKFQDAAQSMKLNVQTREIAFNQKSVDGTSGGRNVSREVLRMNEGQVVNNPVQWNDKYAVIKLDKIKEKGEPTFEDVKDIMKVEAIRIKKAEMEAKKMKGAKSLEELATKMNLKVQEAEITFSSTTIPGITGGAENEVIGTIVAQNKVGVLNGPIKGKSGVYVVVIENITEPAPITDMAKSRTDLTNALRSRSQNDAYSAIREKAKIEDKRPIY